MSNNYVAFFAVGKVGEKREDGLTTGELRFFWLDEDGKVKNHRLKSLHEYELGEIMIQLGYEDDREVMKESPETYKQSMIEHISTHFEEDLEKIKSGEKSEEIPSIVIVNKDQTLEEAMKNFLDDEKTEEEVEVEKPKIVENDNNKKVEEIEKVENEKTAVEEAEEIAIE